MIFITITRPPYAGYPPAAMDIRADHILQMQYDPKRGVTWLTLKHIGSLAVAESADEVKALIRAEVARLPPAALDLGRDT